MSRSNRCMVMTLPSGTTVKVPYVADLMSFIHEDMEIRNPMQSQCGRFGQDPKEYGFEEYHTGGGCMALRKELPNGDYFLLTDADGVAIPKAEEWATALYGRYSPSGEPSAVITLVDVPYAHEE